MDKKFPIIAASLLAIVAIASLIGYFYAGSNQSFHGSVIKPPLEAMDFTLTNQAGATSSLSDYRGKYVFLFFGYTQCTSECPATMAVLNIVREQLGKKADKIQVVLVTTDPVNDTPDAVKEFVERFDPSFVGFTGEQASLQKIWSDYGVTVMDGGATHTTIIYLINPKGEIQMTYPSNTTPDDIVADMNILLKR